MRALYDSLVLIPFADGSAPGFRVYPNTRALYSVRLWGPLAPLWADRFSLGLSGLGLSILNGFARQDRAELWGADFLITPTNGAVDPTTVDYLALTRTVPPVREPAAL